MNDYKKQVGRQGEREAVDFLKKKGFRILETNYQTRLGEIDCIAQDGAETCFIEIKSRSSGSFGDPLEFVTVAKQKKICLCARQYMAQQDLFDAPVRFDAVAVFLSSEGTVQNIRLVKNAFEFL